MDDLDRLLADSMRSAADHAPSDGGLLSSVHRRSRRHHRRRVATGLSTAAAVLALGVPFGVVLATRDQPVVAPTQGPAPAAPAPATSPSAAASPSSSRSPATSRSPARTPSSSAPTTNTLRLVDGWTAPTFPYTLPATDGMSAPVASMRDGTPIAFFEATDLQDHADITITVSSRKPSFTTSATESAKQVRGHSGTLRTVDVQPAKQLTLFWQESAGRWIQLATDDTYTPKQVVALADSLTSASIAVLPPFTLDLTPSGLAADTVTASRMTFRNSSGTIAVVLRKRQQLTDTTGKAGKYKAQLTRDADGAKLAVDVTDWDATLEITVSAGLTVSDTELTRFASGVHILNRSDPE
ncbi:hypothetical protein GCM10010435_24980 [Winogradskya consettensis]|uniref:Uncharacterized protein n=1 Tax=Winogradskya consettensis TaxID=113560 RepID=A0A919SAA1_9ACTN|nr:hypothetical protein [Actinoplanes consettensis]GIM67779.1 hypothetical protein Aco04nite_07770 [Actinoplanes consettensis]